MNERCPHLLAKFDFYAQDPDELTILKGEELILLDARSDWWKVMNSYGIVGCVPSNHVKVIRGTIKSPTLFSNILGSFTTNEHVALSQRHNERYRTFSSTLPYHTDAGTTSPHIITASSPSNLRQYGPTSTIGTWKNNYGVVQTSNVYQYPTDLQYAFGRRTRMQFQHPTGMPSIYPMTSLPYQRYQPMVAKPPQPTGVEVPFHCQALYPYNSKLPDELTVTPGDVIMVTKQSPDNWWYGDLLRNNTVVSSGWFPANFVQSIPQSGEKYNLQAVKAEPTGGGRMDRAQSACYYRCDYPVRPCNPLGAPSDNGGNPSAKLVPPPDYNEPMQMIDGEALRLSHVLRSKSLCQYLNHPWCWGDISRSDAELMLTQFANPGEFIVRDSESLPGDVVITVNANNRIWNFMIHVKSGNYYIGTRVFGKLDDVITHYHKYFILNDSTGSVFLNQPFTHPGFVNTSLMVNNRPVCLPVYRIYDTP